MMSTFNHDLLLLARRFRGKSQGEVAAGANLDQGFYSRVERGLLETAPSEVTVKAIADALDFPLSFFFQSEEICGLPLSVHGISWRKKASVNVTEIRKIHAELNIRIMHLRQLISAVDISPELPLPQADVDDFGGADKVAHFIRKTWMLPDGPIKNLTTLCERAGILVIICNFAGNVDGLTIKLRDVPPIIFLNKKAPADRMRHSLCHELGHLIMHTIPTDNMEAEADSFAGEFLVPASELKSDLIGSQINLEKLVQLKRYWRVSVASLLYRAGSAHLISSNKCSYLWRQLSALGWRKTEPEETQFPKENTRLYDQILNLHKDVLGYSIGEFSKMLHVNENDLAHLYDLTTQGKQKRDYLRLVKG